MAPDGSGYPSTYACATEVSTTQHDNCDLIQQCFNGKKMEGLLHARLCRAVSNLEKAVCTAVTPMPLASPASAPLLPLHGLLV